MSIAQNYERIREEVPDYVTIVAAAKTRTTDEVRALIDAGATDIGENYVQEAEGVRKSLGSAPKDVLLVGDTKTDMQTARLAGMVAVGALWGFRTAEELRRHGAKHLGPQPSEILDLPEWKAGEA